MQNFVKICRTSDLIPQAGVAALLGNTPIALFMVQDQVFALDNFDPIGQASVLSRGIVGSLQGRLVVASPLYKQHFDLTTGECLEDQRVKIATYAVNIQDDQVWVALP